MIPKIAAIIPARLASTRFPNKPLLKIHGLPMIEHVRRRVLLCAGFSDVVVATCDEEIASVVRQYDGRVVMTSPHHTVATERVVEAVQQLDCTHVVNVQGDEILLVPQDVERMLAAIVQRPDVEVWNAIAPLDHCAALRDRAQVKCVVTQSDRLLFCSRDFSGLPVDERSLPLVCLVVGILAYRREFLGKVPTMAPTGLERLESIEQSRFLEHDIYLQGIRFAKAYPGINTPEEAQAVERILREDNLQQKILHRIL